MGGPQDGFEHVSVLYRGVDELVARMATPILTGLEQGEAVLVSMAPQVWEKLGERLGAAAEQVDFLDGGDRYARPVQALASLHEYMVGALSRGATRVQSWGEIDPGRRNDPEWIRYEAACNDVFATWPLLGACTIDLDALTPSEMDHLCRNHPLLDEGLGVGHSERYEDPRWVAGEYPVGSVAPERPADTEVPAIVRPAEARAAFAGFSGEALGERTSRGVLAISELVTNAIVHAKDAPTLRMWREPTAVAAEVLDRGPGVTDPFAGFRPPSSKGGGAGLWITNLLADDFAILSGPDGGTRVSIRFDL